MRLDGDRAPSLRQDAASNNTTGTPSWNFTRCNKAGGTGLRGGSCAPSRDVGGYGAIVRGVNNSTGIECRLLADVVTLVTFVARSRWPVSIPKLRQACVTEEG